MGVLQRAGEIFAANVNDLVDRFEQPEKMLRQALRDLDATTATAQISVARSIAAQRLLEKERNEQATHVDAWNRRATAAVARDDDRLARRAIAQRLDAAQALERFEEQLAESRQVNDVLRGRLDTLRAARADARQRLAAWVARRAILTARRETLLGAGVDCRGGALARVEGLSERLALAEAETIALDELLATSGDDLARDFADHERDETIEAELARLKQSRGG